MQTTENRILENMPLANMLAYKRWLTTPNSVTLDELKSAAYLGLVEAADSYDFKRKTLFSTYAGLKIYCAMQDCLRELAWGSAERPIRYLSLDAPVMCDDEDEVLSMADTVKAKETQFYELFCKVTRILDPIGSEVFLMYYNDGLTLEEVASHVNKSKSRVGQILETCCSRINCRWKKDELWEELAA